MTVLPIAIVFMAVLCMIACRANARFADRRQLPMQWWLDGQVTWWAPRRAALAFIPALGAVILGLYGTLALTLRPRVGQEALVVPTLVGLGTMFVAIQLFHLWLVARTLGDGG